ncbi:MAG: TolC family protein [Planctomycetota bacterium]|jgi:cobalt-zinc-cadmium efflux system outer membrane protein
MIRGNALVCPWWFAIVGLAGCATVDPQYDYQRTGQYVAEATGQAQVYQPDNDALVEGLVEKLLADGITSQEAAQICLLNSPTLQAAFMNVGLARADVVQSGLLSNPSLGIALQLPAGGGLANLEGGLAQNIADLWQIPVRKRAAERSLDQAILGLARQAADLAADTKVAYYEAVGADESLRISQENLVVAQNLLELALTRQQVGAANELDVNLSRSLALDAELEVEAARLAAADARRRLATLLGLTTDAGDLALLDPLPEVPPEAPAAPRLLELARASRLDLRSAQQAVYAAEARLQEEYRRVFPIIELGVALERGERGRSDGGRDLLADTARASIANGGLTAPEIQPRSERRQHTDFIIGPSLDLELPIFDQNQAQIAKAQYAYEQASKMLEALDRAVTQEVRSAVDRTLTASKLVRMYQNRSIPLAQSNLDLSREAYRAGRASFLSVLEAQRFFLETRNEYVGAAQTAATAILELERTIGLPFPKLVREVDADAATDTGPAEETEP